jgi:hypothetical protein
MVNPSPNFALPYSRTQQGEEASAARGAHPQIMRVCCVICGPRPFDSGPIRTLAACSLFFLGGELFGFVGPGFGSFISGFGQAASQPASET